MLLTLRKGVGSGARLPKERVQTVKERKVILLAISPSQTRFKLVLLLLQARRQITDQACPFFLIVFPTGAARFARLKLPRLFFLAMRPLSLYVNKGFIGLVDQDLRLDWLAFAHWITEKYFI